METEKTQIDSNTEEPIETDKVKISTKKFTETFPPDGDALAMIGGIVEAVCDVIVNCLG